MARKQPLYPHVPKRKEPIHLSKLRQQGDWVYAKVGMTEVRGKKVPVGIDIEQVSPSYDRGDFDQAVKIIEEFFGRQSGTQPPIWPPFQKFLDDVRASIHDEMDGYNLYRGMATTATAMGLKEWAATLEQMAKDEYRHRGYLEEILKEADAITSLSTTEGNPIRKFCCRQCGECAPPELLEEGRFPDRIAWLRSHYKAKHPGIWGKA